MISFQKLFERAKFEFLQHASDDNGLSIFKYGIYKIDWHIQLKIFIKTIFHLTLEFHQLYHHSNLEDLY